MVSGLSNLVVSMVMLAIAVPIGVVLVERSLEASSREPSVEVPALVRAYAIVNGSSWHLVIINYGSVGFNASGLILYNGSFSNLSISVPGGSLIAIDLGARPIYIVANPPEVIHVEVAG